jgi:hypothetical protein
MSIVIRPSSLTSYPDCARRTIARTMPLMVEDAGFKLRQVDSHIGACIGTGTHSAVRHMLEQKMATGDTGKVADYEEVGIASLNEEVAKGAVYDEMSPNIAVAVKQVQRQSHAYRVVVAPKIQPVMVETRLEAEFGPFTISGQIDVADDGVHDLKTGKNHDIHMPQLGTYSLLLKAHGRPSKHITEDYVPRSALNKEQGVPISTVYDAELAERVAKATIGRMARDVLQFRETGDPLTFMANPGSRLCGEKFCSAFGTTWCREHKEQK